ncbi:hypothetical protein ACS0TY_007132 [Phlomoides rotata]
MAAFSSVVALEQLLNQISNSDQLPKEEVVPLRENISSLKSSLEKIFPAPKNDRKGANDLAVEIREKIFQAQDKIESFIFTQSHPSESAETSKSQSSTPISLQEITANIDPIVDKAKELGDTIAKGINYTQSVAALDQLRNLILASDKLLPKEELGPLRQNITSMTSSLEKIFPAPKDERKEANDLAVEITKIILEAQDKIKSFISTSTSKSQSLISISLQEIRANIDPIVNKAKELGDKIAKGRKSIEEPETYKSSTVGGKIKIVGQEKDKALIEKKLTATTGSRLVIPISGMPGIGKTTLARSIYEDDKFMTNFPYKAWVTVSQDANVQDILGKILHTLDSRAQKAGDKKYEGDEAKLRVELHQALSNNKYLVVVDDMWDRDIWMKLLTALPDNENSSRILLTTRSRELANSLKSTDGVEMQPLNEEDSWTLLRNRTFGDDKECPPNLENLGRDISKHCKGLPLSLTVIGGLLSQASKEPEYWQTIAEDTYAATANSKVEEAYLEILSLSYDYLPSKLKGCFLYMGAFPEDSDIAVSKIIRLWVAEGFLTILPPRKQQLVDKVAELSLAPKPKPPLIEDAADQSLRGLIDRNLVLIRKNRDNGLIKTCGMHDSLKDLAEKESLRDMFFHSRKRYSQKPEKDTNSQRRVSVHKNILMCLEEVYNSTKEIEKPRSLLYLGHHHHHPMPFTLSFDLLRVLDAFTVYFIGFPDEFLKLVHLRYLSFTYNGKLPSKIAQLHKLQVLIVKRQPKIIFVGMPFLPDEIWNMKELRHLLITETDLPFLTPTEPGTIIFEKLQTLSNINADSCTEKVLQHAPNLKRLGMWMEGPKKVEFLMNKLDQLEIFKFKVLNPILKPTPDVQPKFYFPNTVNKLNLSGTGLPWEDMEAIAALPNLQVLKLKELAFHGAQWCPTYGFLQLKFLLIEYLNLENWEAKASQFPRLEQLIFRHCYDLEDFDESDIKEVECLQLIELVDCSPKAVQWAEDIKIWAEDFNNTLRVRIYSSWE